MYDFDVNGVPFYPDNPLVLIAGPCVIESEDHCLFMAEKLKTLAHRFGIPLIFKASYLKANRSSIHSFAGPGLEEGLRILDKVRNGLGLAVTSDVHTVAHIASAATVLDMLQIPAFLCRQTELILGAAGTGKPVNVKKGQFLAPGDAANIVDKIKSAGNSQALVTERGTTFGYGNLVVDMRAFQIIRDLGIPVVFDATHSVQLPGSQGSVSGGQREFVGCLARSAVAAGVNAVFMEVHDNPDSAKCDGPNMIDLETFSALIPLLMRIDNLVKSR
jgi:2-dehydro-3-deoxyphosphooctonate aldolase (KDO 8-P synthase)